MRILAVDDSESARRLFRTLLVGLGVGPEELRLAADAPTGLREAAEWRPDVVFIDMELRTPDGGGPAPGDGGAKDPTTGDSLGRALLRQVPRPRVVVVTALDRDHPRVRALLADGAADAIMKPVRAARVHEVLVKLGFPPASAPSPGG
jgi:CheY-like chemotaxis protein